MNRYPESNMRVFREVAYGGPLQVADVVLPDSDGPVPLVLCIHGGGWISGDRTMYHEEAAWLAHHGLGAACVSYRLAPLHPFPAAIADIQAAARFFQANAQEFGIDADRMGTFGNSAGGHLSLMLGLSQTAFDQPDLPAPRVQAVVSVCGISDIRNPREAHNPVSWGFLDQFLEGLDDEEKNAAASPITHVHPAAPPILLLHGDEDDIVPVSQSQQMAANLSTHGVTAEFIPLPGEGHSFTLPGWTSVRHHTLRFLRDHLGIPA